VTTSTQRIVARLLIQADSIGDPRTLLQKFKDVVNVAAQDEDAIPSMRKLQILYESAVSQQFPPEMKQDVFAFLTKIPRIMRTPEVSYGSLKNHGAQNLFLTLLQNYSFPPQLRKKLEAGSKFYGRSRVLKPNQKNAIETYVKMLNTYQDQIKTVEEALRVGAPHGDDTQTKFPAGPFTLVNTGGFDSKKVQAAITVVEKAAQLLQACGLGRICYGDILLSKSLTKANVLAFYLISKDEMFIRGDLKGSASDIVRTVCHELAHRLHYKFLKSKDDALQGIYRKLLRSSSYIAEGELAKVKDKIKPGTPLKSKGVTYMVERLGLNGRLEYTVYLYREEDPKSKATVSLEAYADMQGFLPRAGKFVSNYAKKGGYAENFAEMVSFYATGNLPPDQIEMLEEVIN